MKTTLIPRLCTMLLTAGALCHRPAAAAVNVYGEASSSGPSITVRLFMDAPDTALRSFGVRLAYPAEFLYVQSATKNTANWYFFDGTNQIPYIEPDSATPGTVILLGGKMDAIAPLQGVMGKRVLLGTVIFGRQPVTQPLQYSFSLGLGRPTAFANFVTTSGTALDTVQGALNLLGVTSDPNDTNLNGLPDAWEIRYFSGIGKTTWSDDPDGDGFNNQQEYVADTKPTDRNSYPHISAVTAVPGGVSIQWQAGMDATQYLQRRFTLYPSGSWQDVFTNPPPTGTNVSRLDTFGADREKFYRLRFAR